MRKKERPIVYDTLVRVSKNVIITILIDKAEGVRIGKVQSYYYTTNEESIGVESCQSTIRHHGGRAPYDIKELLTYPHLHQIRKEWLNFFYPYYIMFIPGLTKKKFWELVVNRREERIMENQKYYKKSLQHRGYYPNIGTDRMNNKSTSIRLFPLKEDIYKKFFINRKLYHRTDETLTNRDLVRECDKINSKIYCYNNLGIEFNIINGKLYLLYI